MIFGRNNSSAMSLWYKTQMHAYYMCLMDMQ